MNSGFLIDRCIFAWFCGEARTRLAQSGPAILRSAANPIDYVPSTEQFATFSLLPTSPHPPHNSAFSRDRWVDHCSNLTQFLLNTAELDLQDRVWGEQIRRGSLAGQAAHSARKGSSIWHGTAAILDWHLTFFGSLFQSVSQRPLASTASRRGLPLAGVQRSPATLFHAVVPMECCQAAGNW